MSHHRLPALANRTTPRSLGQLCAICCIVLLGCDIPENIGNQPGSEPDTTTGTAPGSDSGGSTTDPEIEDSASSTGDEEDPSPVGSSSSAGGGSDSSSGSTSGQGSTSGVGPGDDIPGEPVDECTFLPSSCGDNILCAYYPDQDQYYCIPAGDGDIGDECEWEFPLDCRAGTRCTRLPSGERRCVEECNPQFPCSDGGWCTPSSGSPQPHGVCLGPFN